MGDVLNVGREDILLESADTLRNEMDIAQADQEAALEATDATTTAPTKEGEIILSKS